MIVRFTSNEKTVEVNARVITYQHLPHDDLEPRITVTLNLVNGVDEVIDSIVALYNSVFDQVDVFKNDELVYHLTKGFKLQEVNDSFTDEQDERDVNFVLVEANEN